MTLQRKVSIFGFVSISFLALYILGTSETFRLNSSKFSSLITADVLLTIPFIYFLLIRKTSISKLTIIPVTIVGVILASFIIPKEHQVILNSFKIWILPVIEILAISFIIHLKNEITMTGLYGIKRKLKSIALNIDKPEDFKLALKNAKSKLETVVSYS